MKFFLIFLINIFIKQSIEEIINNKRIEEAINYTISNYENIPIKNDSIIFKYEKYKIICNNFRLMNPDLENITIYNSSSSSDSNYYIYNLENIKFTFVFNIKIIHNPDFKVEEKDNFLEINCPKISYKYDLKNDFLFFESINFSESISFYLNSDIGIDTLDFYKEVRRKDKCLCKFESEENYEEEFSEVYMIRFLKYILSYYISEIEINDILSAYDIRNIFSNTLIKIDNFDSSNLNYIKYNKILIPFDKMETIKNNNERKLLIHQLKLFGVFNLTKYNKEYEFNFELREEQDVEFFNRNLIFNFTDVLVDTNFEEKSGNKSQIIEILKSAVINNYSKILIDSNKKYYFIEYFNNFNL